MHNAFLFVKGLKLFCQKLVALCEYFVDGILNFFVSIHVVCRCQKWLKGDFMKLTGIQIKRLFIRGSLLLLIVLTFVSQTAAQIDASFLPDLISWWDGDTVSGTTAFDIQDGNNGTLMNGATTAPGKVGKAFSLDGVDDYIEIADNINLKPTNAITVNAWVKSNSIPDGVSMHFIDRHSFESGKPNEGYALACNSAGLPSFGLWTNPASPIQKGVSGTTNIVDDKFHHLAGTYDGSFVKIYVDGVLENSVSASGSIVYAGTLNLWLGANQQPSQFTRRFKGLIDEVQIYNRALSASEIQQLYQGQGTCSTNVVTFTAGTHAKAAEVNANFDALNCQIQVLNSQVQALQGLKAIVCQDHPTADICK